MQDKIRRKCFETKTSPHLHDLRLTSLWLTRRRADAEDLVEEALVKAYKLWHPSMSRAGCRVLLFKVMTLLFFSGFQKRPVSFPLNCQRNIDATISRDRFALVREGPETASKRMIVRLPIEVRFVRFLSKLKRFSPEEIAEIIELNLNAAASSSNRGNKLLQAEPFTYSGQG